MAKDTDIYVQNTTGEVYKVLPQHLLKISPWEEGEDRRVYESLLDGDYRMLTYKNACMIVNSQFNSTNEHWSHKGKKYLASSIKDKNITEHTYLLSTLPNHNIILKDSKNLINKLPNHTLTLESNDGKSALKLVKHKGKIYYIMIVDEYLPRVKAYNLFGEFCSWCGIQDCKPVFCETDKRYI